jgi:hypothetical protein
MQPLSSAELLDIWELGLSLSMPRRALMLLSAAYPGESIDSLARQPIGWRDDSLLMLRGLAFGSRFESLANCPVCGERVELVFETSEVRVPKNPGSDQALLETPGGLRFRLPNSLDMLYLMEGATYDPQRARLEVLKRCLESENGNELSPDLAEKEIQAIVAGMAQADPQADVRLSISCPACSHNWSIHFDILSFFWKEVDAWARRLLLDIHILARSYGWRESDILSLSPWRRQAYVEMARG